MNRRTLSEAANASFWRNPAETLWSEVGSIPAFCRTGKMRHNLPFACSPFQQRHVIFQLGTAELDKMVTYPDEWRTLSQPHVRSELIEYLKSTAGPNPFADRSELEFLVHFIFDDHDFAPDAKALIGIVLFDASESESINSFVNALNRAIGPGKDWPRGPVNDLDVRTTAEAALRVLLRRGEANIGL
jgi:hypothetical protein